MNQFATFNSYINSPVANHNGELYSLPFNMNTFKEMWGVTTPEEAKAKIEEQKKVALQNMADKRGVSLEDFVPENLEEQAISLVGTDIYEKLIKVYTKKQWGRECTELPTEVTNGFSCAFKCKKGFYR